MGVVFAFVFAIEYGDALDEEAKDENDAERGRPETDT